MATGCERMTRPGSKQLVVLNPFPVYPPISGGQGRVFYLYKYLADYFDITLISFAAARSYKVLSPGFRQITVPKSPAHCRLELDFFQEIGFATCAVLPRAAGLTPEYAYVVREQSKDANALILSHPYLYNEVQNIGFSRTMIYDAHNVEYDLQRQNLPANVNYLLEDVKQAEQAACRHSQLIAACSRIDADILAKYYHIPAEKFIVVPNGADTHSIPFIPYEQRLLQKASGSPAKSTVIYMGSNFPPNLQAARQVLEIAGQLPAVRFWLLGSICESFVKQDLPGNVDLLGVMSEQEKYQALSLADIALNPILSGSGTHLKLLEYMAAGLPVITTLLGARGICEADSCLLIICECRDMPARILDLLNDHRQAVHMTQQAYQLVNTSFSWSHIASNLAGKLSAIISR